MNSSSSGGTTSSRRIGPTSLTFTSGPSTFSESVKNFVGDLTRFASAASVLVLASAMSDATSSSPMWTPSGITGVAWTMTRTSAAATHCTSSRHSCPPTDASPNASAGAAVNTRNLTFAPSECKRVLVPPPSRWRFSLPPAASISAASLRSRRPDAGAAAVALPVALVLAGAGGGVCTSPGGGGGDGASGGGGNGGGAGGGGGSGGEGIGGMCEPSSSLPV